MNELLHKCFPPHLHPNQISHSHFFFPSFSSLISLSRFFVFRLTKHLDLTRFPPISSFNSHRSSIAGTWMSANRAPPAASSSNPPDQIMQSMKRQLPFSSMKPPFVASGDYHRFGPNNRRNLDQETEAIVVKTPVSF